MPLPQGPKSLLGPVCYLPWVHPQAQTILQVCAPLGLAKGPLVGDKAWGLQHVATRPFMVENRVWVYGKEGSEDTEDRFALHFNPHRNGRMQRESRIFTSFSWHHTNFPMHLVVMLVLKHSCLLFINKNVL